METPTAIPRLRVSRMHQPPLSNHSPEPGPSRLHSSSTNLLDHYVEDAIEDDKQDTPRLTTIPIQPEDTPFSEATPAARLKAVLERTSAKTKSSHATVVPSAAFSEYDSDFDIPTIGSSQPSLARETLNSLFTHALRDPGDTPQKSAKGKMRRRNSIDTSEFESSPRVTTAQKDRISDKGKRRSMSDDELSSSNVSTNRSQAAIFDSLRQRLVSGTHRDQMAESSQQPASANFDHGSLGTSQLLDELHSSQLSPPAATSTPQHSLKISLNSQFQSNLLDQDSEMQQAMNDLDSLELSRSIRSSHHIIGTDFGNSNHYAGPSSSTNGPRLLESMAGSLDSAKHDHTSEASQSMRHSASTHVSTSNHPREHVHQRQWNQHYLESPDAEKPQGSGYVPRPLSQLGSSKLIHEKTKDDYHRLEERESLPKSELEKSRNKQGPPLSFPNMNSTLPSERSRTVSFPSKSDSRLSTLSPRPSLHRRQHSRSSSRTSSPTGSVFSTGSEMEVIKVDIEHERERNWNAPRPSWHRHPSVTHLSSSNLDMLSPTERPRTLSSPGRPDSRLSTSSSHRSRQRNDSHDSSRSSSRLSSRASSPWIGDVDRLPKQERERDWSSSMPQWNTHSRSASSGNDHSQSHSQIPANPLKRSQSLTQKFSLVPTPAPASPRFSMDTAASTRRRAESLKSSSLQSSPGESPKSRSTSSKPRLLSRPNGYPPRPNSPIPPVVSARPSFNPDSSEPRGGASPEATKLSHSFGGGSYGKSEVHNSPSSHIPVRSLSEVKGTILFLEAPRLSTDGVSQPEEALATEDHPSLSQENQILPPKPRDEKDEIKKTSADITADQADNDHLLEQESTPTLRPNIVLPAFENQEFEAALIRGTLVSETRPQKIITSPPSPPLSSSSESPTTPEPELAHFSLPSTPPSKQSSGSFKLEFRTPSPPRNLPDLPGPPSSISSDYDEITVPAGEFSLLKTPKPPGAWAATPLSSRPIPLRSNSLPTDDEIENGLATPASSLSRAATMSPRTPALPGGWVNTPASRKNVRFFEGPSSLDSEKNTTGRIEDVKSVAIEAPVGPHPPLTSKVTGSHSDGSPKSSRIRSPRKAVTIRVVDAFGREETKKETKEYKLRNDDSVRIVDAMGHTIDDSHDPIPSILDDHPLTRMETLGRVRSSLRELREELTEKEAERVPKDVQDRIRSLQRTSVEARQSRTRLTREMLANTDNLKAKLAPLRASMQRSATSPIPSKYERRSIGRSWLFWILLQMFIIFLVYRAARSYAKTKFLTTYYDPLYPDLFFYTSLPTNYCSSPPVLELFQREGLQAAALKALDYIAIVFYSWQLPCHPAFYDNGSSNPNWPPS